MKYGIELFLTVEQELAEAFHWYKKQAIGLGLKFINEIDVKIRLIAQNPGRYPIRKNNFRETVIKVFPYTIIYEILKRRGNCFSSAHFSYKAQPRRGNTINKL